MMKKKAGLSKYIFIILFIIINCYAPSVRKIPQFNYPKLYERFQSQRTDEFFPIVVQPSSEEELSVSDEGYMVFSSEEGGISDIWLKNLNSVVRIKIIEHPSQEYSPFLRKVNDEQFLLVYLSNYSDLNGDLMITKINPKEIIESYLTKSIKINFWDFSINLSEYIEKKFERKELNCRGKFPEEYPFISEDAKYLYFLSTRCTGKYNLWRLHLRPNGKPEGEPEIVISDEVLFPSIQKDLIVYNTRSNNKITSIIKVFNQTNKEFKEFDIKKYIGNLDVLFIKPKIDRDFTRIYGILITDDTNRNGILDNNDKGQLIYIDLNKNIFVSLTNHDHIISFYEITNYIKDSIFFVSDQLRQRDIFFLPSTGIIPEFSLPIQHYSYAKNLKNSKNYFIALKTFLYHFKDHPQSLAFEGEIFYEIFKTEEIKKDILEKKRFEALFQERLKKNPFLEIFYLIQKRESENQIFFDDIENKFKEREGLFNQNLFIKNYYFFRLGEMILKFNPKKSLEYFNFITSDFLLYRKVAFYKYLVQIQNERRVDENNLNIAIKSKENLNVIYETLEKFYSNLNQREKENILKSGSNFLKYHFLFFQANDLISKDKILEAEKLINEINNFIQSSNLQELKFLKLMVLKKRIFVYKKLKNQKDLIFTRNEFIVSYDKDFKVDIDESEIEGLIQSTNEYVEQYRKYAIKIYDTIENELENDEGFLQKTVQNVRNIEIPVSFEIKESLKEFCQENSIAKDLIVRYQYIEYIRRYNTLCKDLKGYLESEKFIFPVDLLFEANQLMYLSSYAFANLINILFIDIYRDGIFEDYYKKWSIFYHRLKVSLALERFRFQIDWEQKKFFLTRLEDLQELLIEKDPFEGKIFDDLLYGYREVASVYAQENFDYSVLYGHAYTLIMKSIEREKFYDFILSRGLKISNSELIRRKKKILLELKEAEYQLLYILTLDPANEDAVLLLTWLYSYIDNRKEKEVLNPPGFVDSLVRFVTRTKPPKLTDGVFFRSIYRETFPARLYEENIKLLNTYIDIRKYKDQNISDSVYLALANNYYRLFNYKKALELYQQIENRIIFDDQERELNYLFFYAKTNFYESNYKKSSYLFEKIYSVYFNKFIELEKNKHIRKTSKINYEFIETKTTSLSKVEKQLEDLRYKLIIIKLYSALTKFYENQYKLAIENFEIALNLLKESLFIKKYNIYNFIALNYLNQNDFENAIKYALVSMNLAFEKGLSRNKEYFHPQTVGGRLIGLVVDFNEDLFIIGESRIPYEIPTLESYNISLGILKNAYYDQYQIDELIKTYEKQEKIVKKYFYDVNLGKKIYISLLNNKASLYYSLNNYSQAISLFEDAYELAYDNNFLKEYYSNFINSYYVFFDMIETHLKTNQLNVETKKNLLKEFYRFQKNLNIFRENYYNSKLKEYINLKRIENPGYKLKKIDYIHLERTLRKDLIVFDHIDILLKYYLLKFLNQEDIVSFSEIDKSLEDLINKYKEIPKNELFYTIKINHFIVKYILLSKNFNSQIYENTKKEIEETMLELTEIKNYVFQAKLLLILGDYELLNKNYISAINYYSDILRLLENYYYYFEDISFLFELEERYIFSLIKSKKEKEIVFVKERIRRMFNIFFFFKNKIIFQDNQITNLYNQIVDLIRKLRRLKNIEISERIQALKKVSLEIPTLESQIKNNINELIKKSEIFKNLFFNNALNLYQLKNTFVYLITLRDGNYCYIVDQKKDTLIYIQNIDHLKNCFVKKTFVLIPDISSYIKYGSILSDYNKEFKFVIRTSLREDYPIFLSNVEEIKELKKKNIFNHLDKTFVEEQDIIKISLDNQKFLLGKGKDDIGRFLEKDFTASTVYIESKRKTFNDFYKIFFIYGLTSFLGASKLIDPYGNYWGILGYNSEAFKDYKKNLANTLFSEGLKVFRENPSDAFIKFSLSYSLNPDMKTKIYLLGAMIRIHHPDSEELYNNLKFELKTPADKLSFYVMVLRSYAFQENFKKLQELVKEFAEELSDTKFIKKMNNTFEILLELEKQTPNIKYVYDILNKEDFDTAFVPYIIDRLYKHSSYNLVSSLSKRYDTKNKYFIYSEISQSLLKDSDEFLQKIRINKNGDSEIQNLNLLFYDINNTKNNLLYKILKDIINYDSFHFEELLCDENLDCKNLSDLERKIFFFYLLRMNPYDNTRVSNYNIIKLLDIFYQQSCITGNLYWFYTLEKLVMNQEYQTAFAIYNRYKNSIQCFFDWEESKFYIDFAIKSLFTLRAMEYKIEDLIILEIMNRSEKAKIYFSDFAKIVNEDPKKLISIFNSLNWNNYESKYYKCIYDIFLQRAIKEKDFALFQNIAFLRDQNYKKYIQKIEEIQPNLENSRWISIIEFRENFYICLNDKDQMICDKILVDPIRLRKSLARYFLEKIYYKSEREYPEFLISEYLKITNSLLVNKNYLWFSGMHSYHPAVVSKDMFYVKNPLNFKSIKEKNILQTSNNVEISDLTVGFDIYKELQLLKEIKNINGKGNDFLFITSNIKNQAIFIDNYKKLNLKDYFIHEHSLIKNQNFNYTGFYVLIWGNNYNLLQEFILNFLTVYNLNIQNRFQIFYRMIVSRKMWDGYFIKPYAHSFLD